MKRLKKIYILSGILIAACVITLGVMRMEERKEQIKNSDEIVLEISADSVQSLSWENESETLGFHRDEKWLYDGDEAFPVNEEKINELLEQFQEFGVSFIIENVEDYGQYGLKDPVCTIHLATKEQSYEILLGSYSSMDSKRYVSIGDGNVYLVQKDPLDTFNAVLKDMIDHDKVPSFDTVKKIHFAGSEIYDVTYEENSSKTYCADDVYFTEQGGQSRPLDTSKIKNYLSSMSFLNLKDYVAYNASDEELQTYGLDSPELSVTVDYMSENENGEETSETFVLHVSRSSKEKASANDDEEEEITAYARVAESPIIYQISSEDYKNLMDASYDSLRHSQMFTADFADVNQIDISLEGSVYTLTSEKEGEERTWYYQEEKLEDFQLQNALESLSADSFTGEQPAGQEEISLIVYLDNPNFPKIEMNLYRYDGKDCLAVVDGEPVALVKRSEAVDLIEAVHGIVLN